MEGLPVEILNHIVNFLSREERFPLSLTSSMFRMNIEGWSYNLVSSIIHHGSFMNLEWFINYLNLDIKKSPYCDMAAEHGRLDFLRYFHKSGSPLSKYLAGSRQEGET